MTWELALDIILDSLKGSKLGDSCAMEFEESLAKNTSLTGLVIPSL